MEFGILGPLDVRDDDGRPITVSRPRQRRVLAALLCSPGRVVSVDRLVDAVWDDRPPAAARKQLQNVVSALRHIMGGHRLVARSAGYVLDVSEQSVDVGRFADHLARAAAARARHDLPGAAAALRAGLALWRGPALADIGGRVAAAMAAGLEEQRLSALSDWADAALALGQDTAVIDELSEIADELSLREPVTAQLMTALYRVGRGAEALTRYHRTRRALADELGVEPGPPLRKLFERMLAGDPTLAHRPGHNMLPRDIAHFTGRTADVERLLDPARAGTTGVIRAIDGMAGVGKTTLAVYVAHRLTDQFPDGQLFVDLHGYGDQRSPLSTGEALDVLLRAIGVPERRIAGSVDERAGLWRAEMVNRRAVVVLDNAASIAQVRALLPAAPLSLVLITSRSRLVGLDGVAVLSLDLMSEPDAIALFTLVVGAARVAAESTAVAQVVRLCGYLPLAISIAAARMRSRPAWSVRYLAERLREEHSRLTLLEGDRHGVTTAFNLSHQQLPPQLRRLYGLLGLHPGVDLDRYSAAALAGLPASRSAHLLEALCDIHLLTEHRAGQFRFHDLVREHARARAHTDEPEADRQAAVERLLDYYLQVTDRAADLVVASRRRLGPGPRCSPAAIPPLSEPSDARAWCRAEAANLPAVAELAARHSIAERGWQIPRNIGTLHFTDGQYAMSLASFTRALGACGVDTDPAVRTTCLSNIALLHEMLGEYEPARTFAARAVSLGRDSGDRLGMATSLNQMAQLDIRLGRFAEATVCAEDGAEICRELGERACEAEVLATLTDALLRRGRTHDAVAVARRAAAIPPEEIADEFVESIVLSRLGSAHSELHDHELAIDLLGRSVAIVRRMGDKLSEAAFLRRLAQALCRSGRHGEALERASEALTILREANNPTDPANLTEVHISLGDTHLDLRRFDDAIAQYRKALETATKVAYRVGQAHALNGIGRCLDGLGDHDDARQHLRQARAIFAELGVVDQ